MTGAPWDPPRPVNEDVLPASRADRELATAVVTVLYVTLLGAAAGLVWSAVAPRLSVRALVNNSDAAFHAQIGADAWFLLVGGIAGALCTLLALALGRRDGPGLVVGLAVGGIAAAFVADRVGYLDDHQSTAAALRALGAHPGGALVSELDFRIRALGVLAAWPVASLLVLAVIVAVSGHRR